MSEPMIYTKNYVSADDVIVVSHTQSAFANAYDRDKDSKYVSTGANNDATSVIFTITFYEGSRAIARTVDRLILVAHNFKDFVVEYWNGTAWMSWLTVTNETAVSSIKALSSQSTTQVRLTVTATQTVNAEKVVAEVIFCALQLDPGRDMSSYEVAYSENANTFRSGDGGVQKQVKRFTPYRFEKYEARVTFEFLTTAILESFYEIKRNGLPFLWQPESVMRPDEIYLVNWSEAFRYKYVSQNKGAGFRLDFTVTEV